MGVPLIYLSEYSVPIFFFVFSDVLTELRFIHTAVQSLLDQGAIMDNRFIEPITAGEIIGIKPEPSQNPAYDIAAQAALTYHIDWLAWLQFLQLRGFHPGILSCYLLSFCRTEGNRFISVCGINFAACMRTRKSGMDANCTQ